MVVSGGGGFHLRGCAYLLDSEGLFFRGFPDYQPARTTHTRMENRVQGTQSICSVCREDNNVYLVGLNGLTVLQTLQEEE